jgi:hypothetical protein
VDRPLVVEHPVVVASERVRPTGDGQRTVVGRADRGRVPAGRIGMDEVLHQLQRGQHRLVVLVLVLCDHPVDEPVAQQRA